MKFLLLYDYPPNPGGLSTQGYLLHKGLSEIGQTVKSCDNHGGFQKQWLYQILKPDVITGIGWWADTPEMIIDPQKHDQRVVPWFLADGWVANHHSILNELPLILVTSNWVKETYIRDGVRGDNIKVLPVGINTDMFRPLTDNDKVQAIREELDIKKDEIMILTAGEDVTSKGAQEMFKALAKIKDEVPNFKYVCKTMSTDGSDDWWKFEKKLIEELGLENNVVYIRGKFSREFMPYLLNACDIYAAPSRIEGFGMIQVEAMACGKPVISVNAQGMRDTLVHEQTALLAKVAEEIKLEKEWVGPDKGFSEEFQIHFDQPKTFAIRADINDLAEYSLRLLTDKELRNQLGQNGRRRAVEVFNYRVVAQQYLNLIKDKFGL